MTQHYVSVALAVFIFMNAWFAVSVLWKRNDVADIAWGLGFVMIAWMGLAQSVPSTRSIMMTSMVTIWGLRLAWHIATRNRGKSEDARYAAWRQTWKHVYARSYAQVFLLQGLLLYIIALPIIAVHAAAPSAFGVFDAAGIILWCIGFVWETVADMQLRRFIAQPENKGRLMTRGLWAYSRHPNYFGEVVQWWGIFVLAALQPWGWMTVISPLTITILIVWISGIPLLERKYAGRQDFEEYKKKTSVLFPLPPRKRT